MRTSRFRIILVLIFFSGVFLCGIGAGLGFLEFSSFTYVGTKDLAGPDIRSATLDYEMSPGEKLTLARRYSRITPVLTEDETVPVNTVRFNVKYNPDEAEPFIQCSDGYIYLDYYPMGNGFRTLMASKDLFLEGIKNREITSYKTTQIKSIEVLVNPETRAVLSVE